MLFTKFLFIALPPPTAAAVAITPEPAIAFRLFHLICVSPLLPLLSVFLLLFAFLSIFQLLSKLKFFIQLLQLRYFLFLQFLKVWRDTFSPFSFSVPFRYVPLLIQVDSTNPRLSSGSCHS